MSQLIANSMVHQRTMYQILMNETIVDWATSYLQTYKDKKEFSVALWAVKKVQQELLLVWFIMHSVYISCSICVKGFYFGRLNF